ncbi:hypothetical protein Patl1_07053 [Pistacia atlantica]|uniref:Uncharacterized protein n=1 Tax=Pistacia atlantica TaxID=434234 RepID=A0ACC1ALC3_9ROSI|nr:hypothetical protein Patl1_07053 [Pistacia atlantica]
MGFYVPNKNIRKGEGVLLQKLFNTKIITKNNKLK